MPINSSQLDKDSIEELLRAYGASSTPAAVRSELPIFQPDMSQPEEKPVETGWDYAKNKLGQLKDGALDFGEALKDNLSLRTPEELRAAHEAALSSLPKTELEEKARKIMEARQKIESKEDQSPTAAQAVKQNLPDKGIEELLRAHSNPSAIRSKMPSPEEMLISGLSDIKNTEKPKASPVVDIPVSKADEDPFPNRDDGNFVTPNKIPHPVTESIPREQAYKEQMELIKNNPLLYRISGVETNYGKNLSDPPPIEAGKLNAGQHAVGSLMMMPSTIEQMANEIANNLSKNGKPVPESISKIVNLRKQKFPQLLSNIDNSDPKTLELQKLFSDEMENIINRNPRTYESLAYHYAQKAEEDTDDPRVGAYRWNNGFKKLEDISEDTLANNDYVKKFMRQKGSSVAPEIEEAFVKRMNDALTNRALASGKDEQPPAPLPAQEPKAQNDALADLMDRLYGPELGDQALKKAQSAKAEMLLSAGMGGVGEKIAQALSRGAYKADQNTEESARKMADLPIEAIQQRRTLADQNIAARVKLSDLKDKEALRNPNSDLAKAYRATAAALNPQLKDIPGFETMTPEGIKQMIPMIDAAIKGEMLKQNKEATRKAEEEKDLNRRFEKLSKTISADLAGSRTGLGALSKVKRSAEAIEKMVEGRNPDSLDTREIVELARQLDAILSGGQPTISGMNKLIPPASSGDVSKIVEFITSTRQTAGMGSFVSQMLETVHREKEFATNKIKKSQRELLIGSKDLAEKDPERWDMLMNEHGLLPAAEMFNTKKNESSTKTPTLPNGMKIVKINGQPHQIPASNIEKAKKLVLEKGGTFEE